MTGSWIGRSIAGRYLGDDPARSLGEYVQRNRIAAAVVPPVRRRLSPREIEVMKLRALGGSNEEVAHELGISPQTVKNYLSAVYRKLDVQSTSEAVYVLWLRDAWDTMSRKPLNLRRCGQCHATGGPFTEDLPRGWMAWSMGGNEDQFSQVWEACSYRCALQLAGPRITAWYRVNVPEQVDA